MKRFLYILLTALTTAGVSCIKNDIPYPIQELNITDISGKGFTATVDANKRIVTLTLDERTDIRNVEIDQVKLTDQATPSRELTGIFDMRTPLYVTLSLYQDYEWTISAEQTIERSFFVAGQVGSTVIDTDNRIATAYVPKTADLSQITVTGLKLGPEAITDYSPAIDKLSGNFQTVRFVDVTCHGITERWMLYVLPTDKTVELTQVDAWTRVMWLYGSGVEGIGMGFRYRKVTTPESEWIPVPDVNVTGGSFDARLSVEPQTAYEVVAYCGADQTEPKKFTTGEELPLINGGFEQWCTIKDIVYPFADETAKYWGTGNKGAALGSETLTDKGEPRPGSSGKYGADLKSKFVTVFGIGKFAAGNLFMGEYMSTEGTNGIITFGRPFTMQPTHLRIWVKYNRGIIDKVKGMPVGTEIIKDKTPDNGHIYVALGNWTPNDPKDPTNTSKGYGWDSKGNLVGTAESPICVDTRDVSTLFDSKSEAVIGFGEKILTESVPGWQQLDIEIKYKATDIKPTHIMIVCTASRWGDYFTGSTKSEMWLDDFELSYE